MDRESIEKNLRKKLWRFLKTELLDGGLKACEKILFMPTNEQLKMLLKNYYCGSYVPC